MKIKIQSQIELQFLYNFEILIAQQNSANANKRIERNDEVTQEIEFYISPIWARCAYKIQFRAIRSVVNQLIRPRTQYNTIYYISTLLS